MKKRIRAILVSMMVIILVVSLGVIVVDKKIKGQVATKKEALTPVKIQKVELGAMNQYVQFSGKTKGGEEAKIAPAVPAKIKELNVKEGQNVKKGQVLMVLDSEDIDKQLSQAEDAYSRTLTTINQSQNQLQELKKQLATIENGLNEKNKDLEKYVRENEQLSKEMEILKKEFEDKKITEAEFTKAKGEKEQRIGNNTKEIATLTMSLTQLEITRATLSKTLESVPDDTSSFDSQIEGVRQMYEAALQAKENYVIKAPIDGTIMNLTAKAGEPAISMLGPVMLITKTDTIGIDLQVSKEDLSKFRVGTQVKVKLDVQGVDKELVGKVKEVSNSPDKITNQYIVNININNKDKNIETGMYAKIIFAEAVKNEVISIPKDALVREDGKVFLYKVENSIARKIEVVTGIETDTNIEILSGLSTGEDIVIKGKEYVQDGKKVNVMRGDN